MTQADEITDECMRGESLLGTEPLVFAHGGATAGRPLSADIDICVIHTTEDGSAQGLGQATPLSAGIDADVIPAAEEDCRVAGGFRCGRLLACDAIATEAEHAGNLVEIIVFDFFAC